MNDFLQSASWLRKAIINNPLNDQDIYKFAKLLLKYNKLNEYILIKYIDKIYPYINLLIKTTNEQKKF